MKEDEAIRATKLKKKLYRLGKSSKMPAVASLEELGDVYAPYEFEVL